MAVARPNTALIALRKSRGLTQGDLADEMSRREGGIISADYVSKLERGVITWPQTPQRRAVLREIFGVMADADLGFYNSRVQEQPVAAAAVGLSIPDGAETDLVRRATLGMLGLDGLLTVPDPLPRTVSAEDVTDLAALIEALDHNDHVRGGSHVRAAISAQVRLGVDTLKTASFASPAVRRDWQVELSRGARLAAWSSFDAGHHDYAFRHFMVAQQLAAAGEDDAQRADVLAGMVRQAVYVGKLDKATTYVGLSELVAGTSVTATTRAMLSAVKARAFAAQGRYSETMRAIEEAELWHAQRRPEDDPPHLWFYDVAQLAGDVGHALAYLGMTHEPIAGEAAARLSQAIAEHTEADVRGRMLSTGTLLQLRLRWSPQDAVTEIAAAADDLVAVRSARTHNNLRSFAGTLKGLPDVRGAVLLAGQLEEREQDLLPPGSMNGSGSGA
ncbi:MAG: helix-turn-helix domain-containing protein [Nocardioides sp.]|uniref:helix-turn-helix domain-containing protein n=1 Tax=Nocardioides sp. TaxID=35761 RepID=UPI003D6C359E